MGDDTEKQNWHVLLFFVWLRSVYRVSSFAIPRYFVRAGFSFELSGRWMEGVRDAQPPPKGVGFLRRDMYDPQACQSAGASRTNRRHCDVVARAFVRAARALVLVLCSFSSSLSPGASLVALSSTRKQASASS